MSEDEDVKLESTVLREEHLAMGAKMVPFAGFDMPVQYSHGILAEHEHTRTQASVFDICHMGEFRVWGLGAAEALDRILARPMLDQALGSCRYNFLLNDAGRVLDDLIVYAVEKNDYFIVVNASTRHRDAERIKSLLPANVHFEDLSDGIAKIDLQGPEAAAVMERLGVPRRELPGYYKFILREIAGKRCILSRTGYTGELGFELYFDMDDAVSMWNLLLGIEPVKPAGLGARDTLRLEMGYALYGHELSEEITPIEAGYAAMLKLDAMPERKFAGREGLEQNPGNRKLAGIRLEGRRAARNGARIFAPDQSEIGIVTSGAIAPSLGVAVALGYVPRDFEGENVLLEAGSALLPGRITPLPFYEGGTVRKKI